MVNVRKHNLDHHNFLSVIYIFNPYNVCSVPGGGGDILSTRGYDKCGRIS